MEWTNYYKKTDNNLSNNQTGLEFEQQHSLIKDITQTYTEHAQVYQSKAKTSNINDKTKGLEQLYLH